ncbi:hypothetical protein LEMLEM_LOCUS9041 [Lemmus lemmus]
MKLSATSPILHVTMLPDMIIMNQACKPISALFSHHRRSFLLPKMGTNTETHSQDITPHCERDLRTHSSQRDAFIFL